MENRGPKPLSAEQLKLRGSHRARARAQVEQELRARIGPVMTDEDDFDKSPPACFDKHGKEFWNSHVDDCID
jgi:hypothetical protein